MVTGVVSMPECAFKPSARRPRAPAPGRARACVTHLLRRIAQPVDCHDDVAGGHVAAETVIDQRLERERRDVSALRHRDVGPPRRSCADTLMPVALGDEPERVLRLGNVAALSVGGKHEIAADCSPCDEQIAHERASWACRACCRTWCWSRAGGRACRRGRHRTIAGPPPPPGACR